VVTGSITAGELARKLVHVGVAGFAFLLRELTWPQAAACAAVAFFFNWQVLPRIGGRTMWRGDDHQRGYPKGILLYPLAVLGLILVFREELWAVAAIWAVLGFGDGFASIVGQAWGGPRLPWNPKKGWAGFVAFVIFGSLGATFLIGWTLHLPPALWGTRIVTGIAIPLALLLAVVESLPTTLDDNLTVPLCGTLLLPLLAEAEAARIVGDPDFAARLSQGLGVNVLVAFAAWRARSIDVAGALSAIAIGTLITLSLSLRAFAVMMAFFVVGSAVTKLGYRIKAARGIAQEKGGARGWRNAWANGGVPALLAVAAGAAPPGLRETLTVAYAASVATAAADTCSSETGKAYGRRTFLITTLRPVPPGTEGAVSLEGTLGGLAGGALVAAVGALCGLYGWPAAAIAAVAGLLGSLAESVLGTVAEERGWMDNDLLNATNTAIGGLLAAWAWSLLR
jgi:uncharacterized protein (TIGR00297 family)